MREAIGTGEIVRIVYRGGTEPGVPRDIIMRGVNPPYVEATCLMAHAPRTFRLDRITFADGAVPAPAAGVSPARPEQPTSRSAVWAAMIAAVLLAAWLLAGCDDTVPGATSDGARLSFKVQEISEKAWGERWPFTVPTATLLCAPSFGPFGAFGVVDGHAFAFNGGAATFAARRGLSIAIGGKTLRPGLISDEDPAADRLWRKRPLGGRVSVAGVGLALGEMGCT